MEAIKIAESVLRYQDDLDVRYPKVKTLIQQAKADMESAVYPARVFSDPEVWEVEKERIFGKAWIYLAHISELKEPGDYVLRYIGDNPFIVNRDKTGKIGAFLNACTHRGTQLCRAARGNAKTFRCPYHGWTFDSDGTLRGIPVRAAAYGSAVDSDQWGLHAIPRLEIFQGLIFGCLDQDAMPLEDFLGDMKWYLELLTNRTASGLEVVGEPQRWVVDANWKIPADNFIGDSYHTQTAHQSIVELGVLPSDPTYAMHGHLIDAGNGHGMGLTGAPPGVPLPPYFGLPQQIVDKAKERLTPKQMQVMEKNNFFHSTVFPNLSFLQIMPSKDDRSFPVPMITFRFWQPIGPGKLEIMSYFLVDKDAPEEFREESYKAYLRTFGISGIFEQDDAEIWITISKATQASFARNLRFNYQMGSTTLKPDPEWPGPGKAYPSGYNEFPQRGWHKRYLQYMSNEI